MFNYDKEVRGIEQSYNEDLREISAKKFELINHVNNLLMTIKELNKQESDILNEKKEFLARHVGCKPRLQQATKTGNSLLKSFERTFPNARPC